MSELIFEQDGGVARLTINRPERRNALSPEVLRGMIEAFGACEEDPEVRVLCLTGAGEKAFCSGADLMASLSGDTSPQESSLLYAQLLQTISACPKPVLARINGHVMGGGIGIALASDIAISRDGVRFGTPEVKVGLFPMMIAPLILANMPKKRAMQMILCGEKLSAQEALQFGMINEVVEAQELDAAVDACLRKLCDAAPLAQQRGKQALLQVENLPFPEAVEALSEHLSFLMQTEDAAEGISAFFQKRSPQWKGK